MDLANTSNIKKHQIASDMGNYGTYIEDLQGNRIDPVTARVLHADFSKVLILSTKAEISVNIHTTHNYY